MAGFLFFGIYQALVHGLIYIANLGDVFEEGSLASNVLLFALLLVWAPFTWLWIVTQAGGLILWFLLFVFLARVGIGFSVWLCWRIVEYNKGAVSAIVLLITIGLAISQVILKSNA